LDGCFTYLNEKQGYKIWRGATLHNCIAWKTGSGIQISGRRAKLYGCTIADCSPLIDHSPEEMWNCILMNGRCTFDNEDFSRGYNCWFNVEGMPKLGPGSISSDPEFLNPKKGDFRPSANSPVAGKGSLEKALSYDAAGTLRRNRIDIGAYQHDAEKFICWESDQQEVSPGTFHE